MSDKIIQLNEDLIKHDLKDLVRTKNEILNSTCFLWKTQKIVKI